MTFSAGPASVTTATSAGFSFADKPGVGFSCALDAAAFSACTSPRALAGLSAGGHLFTVEATDAAGNIGKASHSWTIDLTAPTTPTGLTANGVSPNGIDLSWKPSTDDVAVAAYVIYRNGGRLATVAAPAASYQDRSGLTSSTAYTYTGRGRRRCRQQLVPVDAGQGSDDVDPDPVALVADRGEVPALDGNERLRLAVRER